MHLHNQRIIGIYSMLLHNQRTIGIHLISTLLAACSSIFVSMYIWSVVRPSFLKPARSSLTRFSNSSDILVMTIPLQLPHCAKSSFWKAYQSRLSSNLWCTFFPPYFVNDLVYFSKYLVLEILQWCSQLKVLSHSSCPWWLFLISSLSLIDGSMSCISVHSVNWSAGWVVQA